MTSPIRRAAILLALLTAACSPASSLDALVPKDDDAYARSVIEKVARGDTAGLLRELDPSIAGPNASAGVGEDGGRVRGTAH